MARTAAAAIAETGNKRVVMYQEHFGLTRELFRSNPEGESIYVGPQQLATIARLRKALATPDAIATVTGPVGVGKSAITGRALEEIAPERMIARIGRMRLGPDEVLELLLESFSVTRQPAGTIQRFAAFKRLLRDFAAKGTRPFIVVEDARRIGTDALLEIEALTAADTSGAAAANIVLLGDSELDTLLADPGLARMKQRIRLRHAITPFTESDSEGYLRRCVSLAGGDFDSIFASATITALHACSGGIPRVLNNICESVLTEAADCGERPVTAALVSAVASDVYGIEVMPGFGDSNGDERDAANTDTDTDSDTDTVATERAASVPAEVDDGISVAAADERIAESDEDPVDTQVAMDETASAVEVDVDAGDSQPIPDSADLANRTEIAHEAADAPVDELAERRLASPSHPVRSHQDLPELGELLARIGATRPQADLDEELKETPVDTSVGSTPEQADLDGCLNEPDAATKALEPESAEFANVGPDDDETAVAGLLPESGLESHAEAKTEAAAEAELEAETEAEVEAEPEVEAETKSAAEAAAEMEDVTATGHHTDEANWHRQATAGSVAEVPPLVADEEMSGDSDIADAEPLPEPDAEEETVSAATIEAVAELPPVSDDDLQEPVYVADDDDTLEAPILDEPEIPLIDEVLLASEEPEQDWSASDDDIPVLTAEVHVTAANDGENATSLADPSGDLESSGDAGGDLPDFAMADIDELELALSVTHEETEDSREASQDDARPAAELPQITLDNELDKKEAPAPVSNLSRWQEELALANGLEDISDVLAETVFGDKAFDELAARIASSPDPDQLDGLSLAEESPPVAPARSVATLAMQAPATTANHQDRSGAWKFDMSVSRRFELVKELGRAQKEREINAHSMVEITLGEDGYPVDASQGPVPEPIEVQIDTEITQSRMALKADDIEKLAAEDETPPEPEKESRGLFSLFRRSSKS